MKYPNWEDYTDEQKQNAVKQELRLDTHNGTTKDDLLIIIRYMDGENNRLKRTVDKLQEENVRLRRMLEEVEIEGRINYETNFIQHTDGAGNIERSKTSNTSGYQTATDRRKVLRRMYQYNRK